MPAEQMPMNALVLIIEDETEIADILRAYLEREGLRTVHAANGRVGLALHSTLKPDLIVLDIQMPVLDGWDTLAELRRRGQTPVMILTALDQDIDKLQALRIGADDYVVKPFNPSEIVARARAILRRQAGSPGQVLRVGPLTIDLESYLVSVGTDGEDRAPALTLTEFRLLAHMARQPMRVFTRGELIDACLPGGDALDRTVDSHLSNLRRKLDRAGAAGLVSNVRGVGYRLGTPQ